MAGIGEFYTLSDSELKTVFDKAKDEGHDYLVKISYSSAGRPTGMPGTGFLLDMIDFYEDAYGVGKNGITDDLLRVYEKTGSLNVQAVYDLTSDFDNAVQSPPSMLPKEDVDAARKVIEEREYQAAREARPLWKKILGLEP